MNHGFLKKGCSVGRHRRLIVVSVCLLLMAFLAVRAAAMYVVKVPVTDLFNQPSNRDKATLEASDYPILCAHNQDQLSQLLMGERVELVKRKGDWAYVKCYEQKVFEDAVNRMVILAGWVRCKHLCPEPARLKPGIPLLVSQPWADMIMVKGSKKLSVALGTRLSGLQKVKQAWKVRLPDGSQAMVQENDVRDMRHFHKAGYSLRKELCAMTAPFLTSPYYMWGGKTLFNPACPNQWTGIDCSNAVAVIYKLCNIELPRNSKTQYIASRKLKRLTEKNIGDLVFLSRYGTRSFYHVMMYMGNDMLFEASGMEVSGALQGPRIISAHDRLGCSLSTVKAGDKVRGGNVYFGTFLH